MFSFTMKSALELSGVNELDNDRHIRVLNAINKLRELGIDEDVAFPQVCCPCLSCQPLPSTHPSIHPFTILTLTT